MYNTKQWLDKINDVIAEGPYKDNWASLSTHEVPDWYKDAKFGIFIHWGAYSVPAFNCEWYPRNMYHPEQPEYDFHVKTFGPHKEFGYKDFIPMFKAEKFDAEEWAELFKETGAQYVMPVGEHHDGFQMYDSELSEWCASKKGPMRDTLGEIKNAVEKRGIRLCVSSHRIEHWWFMGSGRKFDSDVHDIDRDHLYWPAMPEPDFQDLYSEPAPSEEFLNDWLIRSCELVEKYHPNVFYFDWWIQHSAAKPYLKKFAAFYYNLAAKRGESAVINYKHDAFDFGAAVVDIERGQFADAKPYIWQTDTAVAKNSWCYTVANEYKSSVQIIRDLVDIVSKNGRLLLNIGPKSDGTIPDEDKKILLEIGKWLKVNGEAIYGAGLWRQASEGPTQITEGQFADGDAKQYTAEDIRFTMVNGKLYVICLNMEGNSEIRVKALADADASHLPKFHGIIKGVTRLGYDKPVEYIRTEEELILKTDKVDYPEPVVFCIDID